MKRTIYDCWKCRHHNSNNPYGIDYCEVHDTRCSFAYDDCDNFESDTDNAETIDITRQAPRMSTMKTAIILAIIITCVLMAILSSCTTTKYVPVTETRTEHHWHTDTVRQRDSTHTERETIIREVDSAAMAKYGIQMERNQRAWLVLQREMENRLLELEHMTAQRDTVRDSIPVPYPVVKMVEKPLSWWERLRLNIFNVLLGVIALVIIFFFIRRLS